MIEKAAASAADAGRVEPIKTPAAAVVEKKTAGTKPPAEPVPEAAAAEPVRNKTVISAGAEERAAGRSAAEFADLFEKAIFDGNNARDGRNYTRAEEAYRRALSLNAEDFRAVYGLGNLYSDQGRWEEAEQAYRRAIEMAPDEPAPYIALGFVLTQPLAGKNLLARYTEAERLARRAIELAPRNPLAHDQLGVALELQGEISDETLQAYRRAIEMDPTAALPHAHLGRLLRKRGELRKSSKAYLDAIQLAVDVPTMILVADVMQSQQRYLESEQLLRRALREDPKHPTALFLLGRALTTRGSYTEAEEILKKSAAISPNSFVSYKLLGSLYARQGKLAEAEQSLRKALEVISPNEEKRLALEFEAIGDGYMRDNKKQQAARAYDQAVKLDGERSELTEKLARAKAN